MDKFAGFMGENQLQMLVRPLICRSIGMMMICTVTKLWIQEAKHLVIGQQLIQTQYIPIS